MKLPTKKTTVSDDPMQYTIMLYGPEKVGKTTFASKAPNAIFLATEHGHRALSVYKIDIECWEDLLASFKLLAEGNHDFKTVVIDTVDLAYDFCADWVSKHKLEGKDPSDFEWGAGWKEVTKEFRRVITKFANCGYGMIFISHQKVETIKAKTGTYDMIAPSLSGGPKKFLVGLVDSNLLAEVTHTRAEDGSFVYKRILHARPAPQHVAGSRIEGMPAEIPFDYDEYVKAFKAAQASTAKQNATTTKKDKK